MVVRAVLVKYVATFWQELGHIRYLNWGIATGGTVYVFGSETKHKSPYCLESGDSSKICDWNTAKMAAVPKSTSQKFNYFIYFFFWQRL